MGLRKGTKKVYLQMILIEDKENSVREIKKAIRETIEYNVLAIRIKEMNCWEVK